MRTLERWRAAPDSEDGRHGPHERPHNALTPIEEAQVVKVLTSSRYAGLSPKQLVPQLADEGLYLASESTMYRIQRRHGLGTKKRNTTQNHVTRACTVHEATRSNQVWSWDITWLPTTVRGVYLHLYLVMDVWSRRIVGWRIEKSESADAAAELIGQTCRDANIDPRGLVLHSDNGRAMRGSTMISTLQWLGVVPSFSRPHVSVSRNGNWLATATRLSRSAWRDVRKHSCIALASWEASSCDGIDTSSSSASTALSCRHRTSTVKRPITM